MNHCPPRLLLKAFLLTSLVLIVGPAAVSQDRFVMTSAAAPSDAESTWADAVTITISTHVDLPEGLSIPGFSADSTQSNNFASTRRLRVVQRGADGVLTLQVAYVPAVTPSAEAGSMDLGAALQGKTFVINCGSGSVTNADAESSAATDDEARLVRRECDDLRRLNNLRGVIDNMKIGEKKTFSSAGGVSLFSEDLEQFGIQNWDITLRALGTGASARGTFDIRARAAAAPPAGASGAQPFTSFEGELTVDDQGLNIDLTLRSSSAPVTQTLPDGKSKISSRASLNLKFQRQVTAPAAPPAPPPPTPPVNL